MGHRPPQRRRGRRRSGATPSACRAERIQRLDKDNFWQAGDTGPCGPCSEIFFDKGPAYGHEGGPAHGGEERYLEFWNLVFMQYDQQPDGARVPLPRPSIDTGAGLERILVLLQDVDSVFDIDEFVALREVAQSVTGVAYGARRGPRRVACASWPSTPGPRRSWSTTACSPPTRAGATCCAASCAGPCATPTCWASSGRSCRRLVDAVVDVMGASYPELDPLARLRARGHRAGGGALPPDAAHRLGACSTRRWPRCPRAARWPATRRSCSTTPTASPSR